MQKTARTINFKSVSQICALFSFGLILVCMPNIVDASEIIETKLPNKLHVTALYHQGEKNQPAVFITHGFLQTRNYLTVSSLSNSLIESGYTVLAPTLSLGISHRKRSLPCDAIHTHTMEDDVSEIAFWIDWLSKNQKNKIILIGHSYGSLQNIVYASKKPNPSVKGIIATSLVDVEHVLGVDQVYSQIKTAREQIKQDKTKLNNYKLSYCKKFVSPPRVFLSYSEWTKKRILSVMPHINIPVDVILGSKDKRMGGNWPKLITEKGARLIIIEGANHFFDAEHEFDLLETVQQSIDYINR